MTPTFKLGVGWCTRFTHPIKRKLWPSRLASAYRAPCFFAAEMSQAARGHPIEFMTFDEELMVDQLDGSKARIQENSDVIYFSTHGGYSHGRYRVYLKRGEWFPTQVALGQKGPAIAVFDTCDLVDLSDANWSKEWQGSHIGPALRLVLGFASLASDCDGSSSRGARFAKHMIAGKPVVEAWLTAVHSTAFDHDTYDRGFAIALGDDPQDARDTLDNATLGLWPGPRTGPVIHIAWKLCH